MTDPAPFSLSFPAIRTKKVTGAFDGGAITSDAGVLLLAQAERRLGIVDRLAALIPDGRDPARVVHSLPDILRARVLAIAAGYEDANDLDALRYDPAFMMALGKTPGEVIGLASQPTCSRGWENAAGIRALIAWVARWSTSTAPAMTLHRTPSCWTSTTRSMPSMASSSSYQPALIFTHGPIGAFRWT